MGHGLPDGWLAGKTELIHGVADLGEVVVRLGSVISHDRRGNLIWIGDFENGLSKWDTATSGAASAVDLAVTTCRNGAYSGRLLCNPSTGDYAQLMHPFPYPVLGNFGMEFSFAVPDVAGEIACWMNLYDGSNLFQPYVAYSFADDELTYTNSDWDTVILASDLVLYPSVRLFHIMKLVVDMVDKEYVRLIVNEVEYDLAGIAGPVDTNTAAPLLEIAVRARAETDAWTTAYVDYVLLTQNEP